MTSSNNVMRVGRRVSTHNKKYYSCDSSCSSPVNSWQGFNKTQVSATTLAAGFWKMHFMQLSTAMSRLANGNAKITVPHYHMSGEKFRETKDQLQRPVIILHSRDGIKSELEYSMPRSKGSKETATKRNPILNRAPNEFTMIYSEKILKDQNSGDHHNPFVTALLEEQLLQTQRSINKLKAQHNSMKRNVEQFVHNLKEENLFWKRRQRHKNKATLDDLKGKLENERRSRERTELLNTKLIHELAEANSLTKRFMTNYEKEKICEEVEEERKMMQMAELWREERLQMKLVDAQVVLEDKYNELLRLADSLRMLMISNGDELDAERIKQQVESVNIPRVMETVL
ncbi:hypothetical protein Fmac_009218 [Flemingia macrophylla]|uniref:Uncharacterized protein n=1 Tax=Flemingia macrophylla TaxID=520843 RepID=A0ABD1MZM5_9FABA